jgi:broad specificity phosphatase PhoE
MIKLGLIRHARTRWNLEKKIQGTGDLPLCPEGISQAGFWAKKLEPQKYDMILSSPLIRAQETSRIISDTIGADIVYDEDLKEQDFGKWEGKRIIDIRNLCPGEIELQESRGWDFCPPGGESRNRVLERALRAMKEAAKAFDKKQVLVVTHKSVMKILIYKLLNRTFSPGEPPLLKDDFLHELIWDKKMHIEKLNSIKLL